MDEENKQANLVGENPAAALQAEEVTVPMPEQGQVVSTNTKEPASQEEIFGTKLEYAPFSSRFIANLIDGLILGLVTGVLYIPVVLTTTGTGEPNAMINLAVNLIVWIVNIVYYIYFIGKSGQTPGKRILKIKVVKKEGNAAPGYIGAFLREFVGKFISGIVLGLGYVWILFDKQKQGWHDKIAGTIVVKQ